MQVCIFFLTAVIQHLTIQHAIYSAQMKLKMTQIISTGKVKKLSYFFNAIFLCCILYFCFCELNRQTLSNNACKQAKSRPRSIFKRVIWRVAPRAVFDRYIAAPGCEQTATARAGAQAEEEIYFSLKVFDNRGCSQDSTLLYELLCGDTWPLPSPKTGPLPLLELCCQQKISWQRNVKESDLNEVSVKIKGRLQFSHTNSAFALCLTKERIRPSQVLP